MQNSEMMGHLTTAEKIVLFWVEQIQNLDGAICNQRQ
jgi:hypothetical protein